MSRPPTATEIRVRRGSASLEIAFDDGTRASLPAEYLRVESPSAEVQGHAPHEKVTVAGKREVNIAAVEPIGNYAVRIRFTDGHETGIFSWQYLHTLAAERDARWEAYIETLRAKKLSRDPKP